MEHFLICGGAGFIGRHLALALLNKPGIRITVVDMQEPDSTLRKRVDYIPADVRRPLDFDLPDPITTVVNLSAVHRTPGHQDHEYYETNELGATNVSNLCRNQGVTSLWFTSSIAVYGPSDIPLTEQSPLAPDTAYGMSKLKAEHIHSEWLQEDSSRQLVIVRPGAVFGPGEGGNFTRLARALQAGYFFYPGRSDTRKACGFVGDLVRSLFFMRDRGAGLHLYNYAYPDTHTIREICDAMSQIGDFRTLQVTLPQRPLLAAGYLMEVAAKLGLTTGINRERVRKLLRSTHVVPDALARAGFVFDTNLASGLRAWHDHDPPGICI